MPASRVSFREANLLYNRPSNHHHLGVLAAADLVHILWSRNGFDEIQTMQAAGWAISHWSKHFRKIKKVRWNALDWVLHDMLTIGFAMGLSENGVYSQL